MGGQLAFNMGSEPDGLQLPDVMPIYLKRNESALMWVGAANLHPSAWRAAQPPAAAASPGAYEWVNTMTATAAAGTSQPPTRVPTNLVQGLPWSPGFPATAGAEFWDGREGAVIRSCVAARWCTKNRTFRFKNLHCESAAVEYFVRARPTSYGPRLPVHGERAPHMHPFLPLHSPRSSRLLPDAPV